LAIRLAKRDRGKKQATMYVFVVLAAVVLLVLLMLLVGGKAELFNLRRLMRPWQPKYRDDSKPR